MSDTQKTPLPRRKKNRLDSYDYSSCGAYFITVCTAGRRNLFWKSIPEIVGATIGRPQDVELSKYGKIVDAAIKSISAAYPAIAIDSYVIMPNHIHLLLRVCTDESGRPMVAPTVSRVVNQLKGMSPKKSGKPFGKNLSTTISSAIVKIMMKSRNIFMRIPCGGSMTYCMRKNKKEIGVHRPLSYFNLSVNLNRDSKVKCLSSHLPNRVMRGASMKAASTVPMPMPFHRLRITTSAAATASIARS